MSCPVVLNDYTHQAAMNVPPVWPCRVAHFFFGRALSLFERLLVHATFVAGTLTPEGSGDALYGPLPPGCSGGTGA